MRRNRPTKRPSRARRLAGACRPGFTLVELIVVMGLIGIILAIALPRFDRTRMNVDDQAQALRSTLIMAQRTAIVRGYDVVVAFDTAAGWLRVQEDANDDLVLDAGERSASTMIEGDAVFGRGSAPALEPGRTAALSFIARQSGRPVLVFHRDGSTSEAGTLYLSSRRSTGGAYATDTRAIDVARATGRVEAYRYTTSHTWERMF